MNKFLLCKYCESSPDRSCPNEDCVIKQVANNLYYNLTDPHDDKKDKKLRMFNIFDYYCNDKRFPFGPFNMKEQNIINETKHVQKAIELYLPELKSLFDTYSLLK
jgi:hypothetical protein